WHQTSRTCRALGSSGRAVAWRAVSERPGQWVCWRRAVRGLRTRRFAGSTRRWGRS
ncbi:MAG: hypothetical protein AVDCRST_MAG77-2646, partial [uncultured Chloroflexi bacterium]